MAKKSIDWVKTMPALLYEWNYEKNVIKPSDISIWSKEKVWWKCKKGHEWLSTMHTRQKKVGCPYCSGKLPIIGESDLETTNPELLLEWNYAKNEIRPCDIKAGSGNKVWWKCKKGHEWQASPNHRKNGRGCPICSGKKVLTGFNDIKTLKPELVLEWDYERNGNSTPDKYTVRSGKKVWWKCNEGHSWEAVIKSRTGQKYVGCPYCSGRYAIKGENDLESTNPELIEEWNYEKNKMTAPSIVKAGSGKKVWWKCKKGHEWQAVISSRTKSKNGCPYCSGRYAIKGENDLLTVIPNLLEEWNYDKNIGIVPEQFKIHSVRKIWWKCKKGHEWQAAITDRSRGDGCPYCSGKRLLVGFNDLAHIYPHLSREWNYERNEGKRPENVTSKAGIKVWWKCKKGHEWQALISNRSRGDGCPQCNEGIRTSFPEQTIFYYVKKKYHDAINRYIGELSNNKELDIYIPSLRLGIEYDGSIWHASDKALEREVKKYEECKALGIFLIRVKEAEGNSKVGSYDKLIRITGDFGSESFRNLFNELKEFMDVPDNIDVDRDRVQIQENYKTEIKNKSFGMKFPELIAEWDKEKNRLLSPFMFVPNSGEKIWWICEKGHRWRATISLRSKGSGCPYCSGRYAIKGENDLETLRADIASEWNYEKNDELKPCNVKCQSNKKVWWKCKKGHEWQAIIANRTRRGDGCPYC